VTNEVQPDSQQSSTESKDFLLFFLISCGLLCLRSRQTEIMVIFRANSEDDWNVFIICWLRNFCVPPEMSY
jgi:hypothetical protein